MKTESGIPSLRRYAPFVMRKNELIVMRKNELIFHALGLFRYRSGAPVQRSLNCATRSLRICAWAESSSLVAALSSAAAELACTTLEICSIP